MRFSDLITYNNLTIMRKHRPDNNRRACEYLLRDNSLEGTLSLWGTTPLGFRKTIVSNDHLVLCPNSQNM